MITLSNLQINILMTVILGSLVASLIVNIHVLKEHIKIKKLEKSFVQVLESVSSVYSAFSDYLSREAEFLTDLDKKNESPESTAKYIK